MKPIRHIGALAALLFASTQLIRAADAKTYQVTCPVLEVTETTSVVRKSDDRWEIAKSKSTKGAAAVKVGDKVTIYYRMVADEVEVKGGDKKKSDKKEK